MPIINGTSGDDTIPGTVDEDDVIHGLEGNDTIFGRSGHDDIYGDEGNDTLWGEDGDDSLYGGDGDDTLRGGDGVDFLDGGAGGGSIYGGAGGDLIQARGGGMFIEGEDGDDTVRVFDAGDGGIRGGLGTDTLIFDFSAALQGFSINLSSMWLGGAGTLTRFNGGATTQIENFEQIGSAIVGSAFSDRFVVGSFFTGALTFQMGAGDDEVEGGAGGETVFGGEGDDYLSGNDGDDQLNGGLGNDIILGGVGHDTLTGGGGNDDLNGGHGDDTFYVSGGGSAIDGEAGTDWLEFSLLDSTHGVSMDLTSVWTGGVGSFGGLAVARIERLSTNALVGSNFGDNITIGADYAFGVTLEGRDGNDTLTGGGGSDTLYGGDGNDWLDGLGGTNTLDGSIGNDTYVVSNTTTTVIESADSGTDTVRASIDYSLTDHVENLILTSSGSQVGYGNALNNTLTGGAGANQLHGGDGNDVIYGREGSDFLYGEAGNDTLNGDAGSDTLVSGDGNDTLNGGQDNDMIVLQGAGVHYADGGAGFYDSLHISVSRAGGNHVDLRALWGGGAGVVNGGTVLGFEVLGGGIVSGTTFDDVYYFGSTYYFAEGAYTGARYQSNGGNDYVEGTAGDDTFTGGSGRDSFYGNAGTDYLSGGDGDDILHGGAGSDVLIGGNGDDSYYVDSFGDLVNESGGSGADSIYLLASIDYTLGADIEAGYYLNGAYTGTLSGNDLDNILGGGTQDGAPNGILVGGAGNDRLQYGQTMRGGVGDDRYYLVHSQTDNGAVIELAGEGYDTVYFFQPSYVMHDNVEEAVGGWEGGAQITGNAGNNRITSNSGAFTDIIRGMGGDDELILGAATINGQLYGGDGNDILHGAFENDSLYGDSGNDTLYGGAGDDQLHGGAGNNQIFGGDGQDVAFFDGNVGDYSISVQGSWILVTGASGKTQLTGVEILRFADQDFDPLMIVCWPGAAVGSGAQQGLPLVLPAEPGSGKETGPVVLPPIRDPEPQTLQDDAMGKSIAGDEPIICPSVDPVDTLAMPGGFELAREYLSLQFPGRNAFELTGAPSDYDWII